MAANSSLFPLFFLGLASGVILLPLTAYRFVTPRWLRWVLWASGVLLLIRNLLIVRGIHAETAYAFIAMTGFTLPGVVALDQLIRHPNMTPKKLLVRWCLPLLGIAGATCWWPGIAMTVGRLIGAALVGACLLLSAKIPVPSLRRTLLILGLAYSFWTVAPVLLSELVLLILLWHAYETARA